MALGDDLGTVTTGTLITAAMYNDIINSINFVLRGNMTGAIQANFRTTDIDEHWLICDGRTIGNASSGANRANADMERLFKHLWDNSLNAQLQVEDSVGNPVTRGISANADWTDNRRIRIPNLRGRTLVGLDNGDDVITDTWADSLGGTGGAETHTLITAEMPSHNHAPGLGALQFHTGVISGGSGAISVGAGTTTQFPGTTANTGGGGAHNNLQPSMAISYLICTGV